MELPSPLPTLWKHQCVTRIPHDIRRRCRRRKNGDGISETEGEGFRSHKRRRRVRRRWHAVERSDFINDTRPRIPDNIWLHICAKYLTLAEIGRMVPLVSKRFLRLASDVRVKRDVLSMRFGFRFKNLCLGANSRATEAFWNELAHCFAGCRVIQIEGVNSHMIQCSEDNPNDRMMIRDTILKRARCVAHCIDLIPNEYDKFYAEIPNRVTHLMGWDLKAEVTSKQFYLHGIPMSLSLFVDRCNASTHAPILISIPMHAKADMGLENGNNRNIASGGESMLVEAKEESKSASYGEKDDYDDIGSSFYSFHDYAHFGARSSYFLRDVKSKFTKTENGVRYVRKIQLDVKIILILDNDKLIELISVPLEMDYWGHECCPAVYHSSLG